MRNFEDFEFDPLTGELWRDSHRVDLQGQPAKLLDLLTAAPGELIERDRLREELWDDGVHVDHERCINFYVRQLRRSLDDDAKIPRFVETLPRRGYRFVAAVTETASVSGSAASKAAPRRATLRRAALFLAALLGAAAFGHVFAGTSADHALADALHRAFGIEGEQCPL